MAVNLRPEYAFQNSFEKLEKLCTKIAIFEEEKNPDFLILSASIVHYINKTVYFGHKYYMFITFAFMNEYKKLMKTMTT